MSRTPIEKTLRKKDMCICREGNCEKDNGLGFLELHYAKKDNFQVFHGTKYYTLLRDHKMTKMTESQRNLYCSEVDSKNIQFAVLCYNVLGETNIEKYE